MNPEGVARSRQRLEQLFAEVGERLADGRRYLVGDTFTAADLTFAALAAPILWPPQMERWMGELLPQAQPEMERWRRTPAGAWAMRIWANER